MTYEHYFILSFFNSSRPTSIAQLVHVFQGKRTPSMFYLIEQNKWHHSFTKFKKVSEHKIEKVIQVLVNKKWITPKDKGFVATVAGESACEAYFEARYFPQYIRTFSYANIRSAFWERFQLLTQSFSEMSFKNNKYTPIIKHPHHQEHVRQLFQQFQHNKNDLMKKWVQEVTLLFSQMDEPRTDIIASHLTGYEKVGLTTTQVQTLLSMHPLEYDFFHQDTLEMMLLKIKHHKEELPLLYAIVVQLHQEIGFGLSMSTNETYQLIQQGYSITEISKRRYIKENTVREHILEMAFVLEGFPLRSFVPDEIYDYLHQSFNEKENFTYKQAVTEQPDVEFMHYRLVDLERMRDHG